MLRQDWREIWRFETASFIVACSVTDEYDLDLSWDEDGRTKRELDAGRLEAFVAKVECFWSNGTQTILLADDHLGGCIYKSPEEFVGVHRGGVPGCGDYFSDMVKEVLDGARRQSARCPL